MNLLTKNKPIPVRVDYNNVDPAFWSAPRDPRLLEQLKELGEYIGSEDTFDEGTYSGKMGANPA